MRFTNLTLIRFEPRGKTPAHDHAITNLQAVTIIARPTPRSRCAGTNFMIDTIYLVPHTHTDLGYTDRVDAVLKRQVELLDSVLALSLRGDGEVEPDAYRWTIETACVLRLWWQQRGERERQQVLELLRSGRWQLMALETQLLTQLARPSELRASVDWACRFGEEHGIPVRGIMLNDIAGYARGLPSAVAPRGIQYLAGGVGGFRALLPHADLPWLFNWHAPDGQTLLVWHVGLDPEVPIDAYPTLPASYGFGYDLCLKPVEQLMRHGKQPDGGIDAAWRTYDAHLQRRGYPFSRIMLQFAGDNDGIDRDVPRWIDHWNATVAKPKLQLATPDDFFSDLLAKTPVEQLPQLRGAIHDPWIDHAPTQIAAFGVYRENGRRIEALQTNNGSPQMRQPIDAALREQLWFSDHTFGLSMWACNERIATQLGEKAVDAPEMINWVESWIDKQKYPAAAAKHIAAAEAQRWPDQPVAYTGLSSPVTTTVALPPSCRPQGAADDHVQVAADGRAWALVSDVASDAPRLLERCDVAVSTSTCDETALCDGQWRIAFDPSTGALRELSSPAHGEAKIDLAGFADLVVYDIDGLTERAWLAETLDRWRLTPHAVQWQAAEPGTTGPLVSEIARRGIVALPEGDQRVAQRWRLLHHDGVVEIETIWDKLPRVRREASYLSLPLRFDKPAVSIDQGLTIARVGDEELPGCYRDQYSVHDWVAVADDAATLLVAPREFGMVEVDRVRLHEYADKPFVPQTGSLHFLLAHNMWPTNCSRWQQGRFTLTLRLKLCGPNLSSAALRDAGARLAWPVHVACP
jgi:hypothetical protein